VLHAVITNRTTDQHRSLAITSGLLNDQQRVSHTLGGALLPTALYRFTQILNTTPAQRVETHAWLRQDQNTECLSPDPYLGVRRHA
jgi:hypothetical protein